VRKLVLLVLALALFIPAPASAGAQHHYYRLEASCQEDADRQGVYLIRATFDMWTDFERVKRMVMVFKEYHDYGHITGDDRWLVYRMTKDVAHRSVGGVDIYGWFGAGGIYDVRFDPTSYDVKVDLIARWKGRDGVLYEQRLPVGEKRDDGPCLSYDAGEPPPRP
jgi:hypothetical protein